MSGKHVRRGNLLTTKRIPFDYVHIRLPKTMEINDEFKPQNRYERRLLRKIQRGKR